jgi:hypothetical protein
MKHGGSPALRERSNAWDKNRKGISDLTLCHSIEACQGQTGANQRMDQETQVSAIVVNRVF